MHAMADADSDLDLSLLSAKTGGEAHTAMSTEGSLSRPRMYERREMVCQGEANASRGVRWRCVTELSHRERSRRCRRANRITLLSTTSDVEAAGQQSRVMSATARLALRR